MSDRRCMHQSGRRLVSTSPVSASDVSTNEVSATLISFFQKKMASMIVPCCFKGCRALKRVKDAMRDDKPIPEDIPHQYVRFECSTPNCSGQQMCLPCYEDLEERFASNSVSNCGLCHLLKW